MLKKDYELKEEEIPTDPEEYDDTLYYYDCRIMTLVMVAD